MTKKEQLVEYAKCYKDYSYCIEKYFKIQDKTQGEGLYPFLLFPFQKDILNNYRSKKSTIVNKYRQAGISTLTAAFIACYIAFEESKYVVVVANKLKTAEKELFNDVVGFIDMLPEFLKPTVTGSNTNSRKEFNNGATLVAMASNELRGPTPDIIWWDEAAWCEKGEKFLTSSSASLSTGGKMIMVSTPNGLDAVFYNTFKGSKDKSNDFIFDEIYWYNDPRYNKDLKFIKNGEEKIVEKDPKVHAKLVKEGWEPTSSWYERMSRKYNGDKRKINQELNCSFLGSDSTFIDSEVLNKLVGVEPVARDIDISGEKNIWIWKEPEVGKRYMIGSDVAMGTSEDFSTFQIIGIDDFEQVAEFRGKISPEDLGELLYYYGELYGFAYIVVDIQGGAGTGTVNRLLDLGYKNIHYTESRNKDLLNTFISYIKYEGDKVKIPGFMITTGNRPLILTTLEKTIRSGEFIINSDRLINELKTFVVSGGNRMADHKRSYHDDLIFALAIILYVFQNEFLSLMKTKSVTKRMLESYVVNKQEPRKFSKDDIKRKNSKGKDFGLPIYVFSTPNGNNNKGNFNINDLSDFLK